MSLWAITQLPRQTQALVITERIDFVSTCSWSSKTTIIGQFSSYNAKDFAAKNNEERLRSKLLSALLSFDDKFQSIKLCDGCNNKAV